MGQVTKVRLSCSLVLLSVDSKTREQDSLAPVIWPMLLGPARFWHIMACLQQLYTVERRYNAHKLYYTLLYPQYPKDRGMLWFYVEAARRPPPAARRPQWC